jgi:glucose/mannose transport system substrate-binding protein
MVGIRKLAPCMLLVAWLCVAAPPDARVTAPAGEAAPRAEVIHWWTSGGESAAVQAGRRGLPRGRRHLDRQAIAGGDQSRAVTVNRIIGGNPPTAAQFNTSKQFLDIIEEDMLNRRRGGARDELGPLLPEPIVDVIKVKGHWYAVPMNIHMQTWIWYSKAAFAKAGIAGAARRGRTVRRPRQAEGRRPRPAGARRPGLAGNHPVLDACWPTWAGASCI